MPAVVTLTNYLEISSVPLATPAWVITDMSDAERSADQRGDDILVPHAAGVSPRQRRKTVTLRAFPITIFGGADHEGVAHSSEQAGVVANLDYLLANVVDPTGSGDGTRPAIWHRLDGSEKVADVHVLALDIFHVAPTTRRGVLKLSFPTDWADAP